MPSLWEKERRDNTSESHVMRVYVDPRIRAACDDLIDEHNIDADLVDEPESSNMAILYVDRLRDQGEVFGQQGLYTDEFINRRLASRKIYLLIANATQDYQPSFDPSFVVQKFPGEITRRELLDFLSKHFNFTSPRTDEEFIDNCDKIILNQQLSDSDKLKKIKFILDDYHSWKGNYRKERQRIRGRRGGSWFGRKDKGTTGSSWFGSKTGTTTGLTGTTGTGLTGTTTGLTGTRTGLTGTGYTKEGMYAPGSEFSSKTTQLSGTTGVYETRQPITSEVRQQTQPVDTSVIEKKVDTYH